MRILVTGGCGYKGHALVPKLLAEGHKVRVLDTEWFGNFHKKHPQLETIVGDVNVPASFELNDIDAIIHLASIANDPCGDIDPKLTWETSCLATMQLADKAARAGVKRFIYASSGSVYGVKTEDNVTEELTLEPLSEYNKTKMVSERVLKSYSGQMKVQIVRPATVCGLSPRMRLDVSVNMLTMQALTTGMIKVFGGTQVRPNIHIDDICDLYVFLLDNPELEGVFNAGFENISILEIARLVKERVECDIVITGGNDPRSYRLDSSKLLKTGFKPKKKVSHAIDEIIAAFTKGELRDEPHFHNLNWMNKMMSDQKEMAK